MKRYIARLCYNCNIFQLKCDGTKRYRPFYHKITGSLRCANSVQTPENTDSPLQVKAFQSLFKAKKAAGIPNDTAFANAIAETSDEQFAIANRDRPEMVAKGKVAIKRKPRKKTNNNF